MTADILKIEHLSYSYHNLSGETAALSDLSFTVKKGEFLAIVGPSGCGKSTILSLIAGLLSPEKGTIAVNNPDKTGAGRASAICCSTIISLNGAASGKT